MDEANSSTDKGKLYRLKITQAEMYDLGNIDNITHHILYDSRTRVAVDITAEVKQAPLLSKVSPYDIIQDTSVIEEYLSGNAKPVNDFKEAGCIPCITRFESRELVGRRYDKVRQSMVTLRDARKILEDRIDEMRKNCLEVKLVKPQEE